MSYSSNNDNSLLTLDDLAAKMGTTIKINDFYDQNAFSDVVIKFGTKQIKAHKIILCTRSEYFKKAIGPDSSFKVCVRNLTLSKQEEKNANMWFAAHPSSVCPYLRYSREYCM